VPDVTSLVLAVDSRQVKTATTDLDRLTASSRRVEGATDTIARSFKGLGVALGAVSAGAVVRAVVEQADAYTRLNARLRLVTASAGEFTQAQAQLFQIAQSTRTGLESTVDLFGSLSRSTEGLGKSQNEVLGVTTTINQALQVSGTNAQSAAAALVQLGQGFASGVLRGEELNSVLEQAPRLAKAIADGLGVPIGKLRELGQEGKLTADKVFNALQKSAQSIQSEFNRLPLTVGSASTQASNALLKLIGVIDRVSGATGSLAGIISEAAGFMAELADEITKVSEGAESASILANIIVNVSEVLQVLAANVSFVFTGVGREIGAVAAQIAALARLDIQGFRAISDAVKADAERARAELDALEARILRRSPAIEALDTRAEDARLRRGIKAAPVSDTSTKTKRDPFGNEIKSLKEQIALVGALTELEKINAQITLGKFGKLSVAQANQLRGLAAEYDARKSIFDIAQAQTDIDIGRIKRQLDQQTGAFAAAESILQAQREAGIVDERQFTQQRIALINLQVEAQVRALQAENTALAGKKGSALELLRIQEQIADNETAIANIRAQGAAEVEAFGIRQVGSAKAAQKAIQDTEAALQSYLDSLVRSQSIELGGLGLGNKERDRLRQKADIEDRFEQRRQELLRTRREAEFAGTFGPEQQRQYDAELAAIAAFQQKALSSFDAYYAARDEKERDFNVGASEALQNYIDDVANVAAQAEALFTDAFKGAEDALVEFVKTGKLDVSSLIDQIQTDLLRLVIRENVTGPLAESLKGIFGGAFGSPVTGIAGPLGASSSAGAAAQTAALTASTAALTAQTAAVTADAAATAAKTSAETIAAAAISTASTSSAAALAALSAAATTAAAALATVGATSATSGAFSLSGLFFANGGRPPLGMASVVGEQGPELFIPDGPGTILSNADSRAMLSGAKSFNITINQSFAAGTNQKTVEQAAVHAGRELRREAARMTAG
jgi:lambda family phage tail tape measure protein